MFGLTEGVFNIRNISVTLSPEDAATRGTKTSPGFNVKYSPIKKGCSCDVKKIVLVQATKHDSHWTTGDYDPHFDSPNASNGSLPPAYADGGRHTSNLEYQDSPWTKAHGQNMTWSFEVCALCRDGSTGKGPEVNLGCVTFTFHAGEANPVGPFGAAEPGALWKEAMDQWNKEHSQNK
jgi:hypothetical protein